MSERILMKLEIVKNETMSKLNELFRQKVQFEEQVKENEVQLQFQRGVLHAIVGAQKIVMEAEKAAQFETKKAELVGIPSNDGNKEKVPEVKT